MSARVRIAPSPTGYFHIGTARTSLYNFLFARKEGGTFILRIEDTDKERSTKEFHDDILEQMRWLGLAADETYIQSEHVAKHRELLRKLVDADKAYISKEPAKDDPSRTVEVVRLRNPGTTITFNDVIRGDISFDTTELKDFVIARSIDDPLYHFAVVADDGEAGITHVIRGEDHISNTPRQILIQEALGLPRPIYAHLPLILAPDRTKMSKRKHQTSIRDFRAKGYLPEAMINFIALLGWSEGQGDKEMYSMHELIAAFSLEHIHKGGAVFNEEKLRWFNRQYLLKSATEDEVISIMKTELEKRGVTWENGKEGALFSLALERISTFDDLRTLARDGEFDYFFAAPSIEISKLPNKKSSVEEAKDHLQAIAARLEEISNFSAENVKEAIWPYAEEKGRGAVLWPFRYTLSGREKSPDPFVIAGIIGKEEALKRIRAVS